MATDGTAPNGPGPFTGHPNNRYVKAFREIMISRRRVLDADQTISAFVRAKLPPWLAEQTLAGLTLALQHVPAPPRRGTAALSIVASEEPK